MNILSMAVGFIVLGFMLITAAIFGLGWIWPLIAGIMKRRAGKGGKGLIIFSCAWLAFAMLAAVAAVGGCIWLYSSASERWETPEFVPAEYTGETARLLAPPDCDATLTGDTEDGTYDFTASNGVFTVPAGIFCLNSYSITKADVSGRIWTASWWFYGKTSTELSLKPDSEEPIKNSPPFTMKVTRLETGNGEQRINVQVADNAGDSVSLRSSQKPGIEIVDAAGSVVWSRALSYG